MLGASVSEKRFVKSFVLPAVEPDLFYRIDFGNRSESIPFQFK
jgi:hypothetical protein